MKKALFLSFFFLACTRDVSPELLAGKAPAVVEGEAVAADDRLALFVPQILDPQGDCSGVLVERDLVLTAAHCLSSKRAQAVFKLPQGSVSIGIAKLSCTYSQRGIARRVKRADRSLNALNGRTISPENFEANQLEDFCAIRLKSPAPFPAQPVRISTDESLAPGTEVTFLGWGVTGENKSDFGRLRKSTSRLSVLTKHFGFSDSGERKAKPCDGDSGGPALVFNQAGEPELVGVLSVSYGDHGGSNTCEGFHYQAVTRAAAMALHIEAVKK